MISAANGENIRIEGPGTIDGNGAKFFTGRGDMTQFIERNSGAVSRDLSVWHYSLKIVPEDNLC